MEILVQFATYSLLILPLIAFIFFVIGAYKVGRERDTQFPERWRRRAKFMQWISWACLTFMAWLVMFLVNTEFDSIPDHLNAIFFALVLGLFATVLASIYRYIVRLAYFYEALADAADLIMGESKSGFKLDQGGEFLNKFVLLATTLSPETVQYSKVVENLKLAQILAKLKGN